ncbi:hypothetical protein ACFXNW_01340 [Nocardia sp. NPDC059180]|uniref:hypothetical protein n=1 Tax=Nocardia sp. NPDC059180 TaxID=3346761 RepID=UPI0036D12A91
MSYDEQRLDAIVWPRTGKRFRECTPAEIDRVIAELHAKAEMHRRREVAAGLQVAAALAKIDQYDAALADGIRRAELWANGGAP